MFKNTTVGPIIQAVAKVIFAISILAVFVIAIYNIDKINTYHYDPVPQIVLHLLILAGIELVVAFQCLLIFGFGVLIESIVDISDTNRQTATETKTTVQYLKTIVEKLNVIKSNV